MSEDVQKPNRAIELFSKVKEYKTQIALIMIGASSAVALAAIETATNAALGKRA
jgi:hypothetical protein